MVPYNYNYYGIPNGDKFTNQNSQDIGDLVYMNIWGYYYNNPATWGKPLDDSVYLWKIKSTASFATNASYSISTGNTLNIDIAYNNQNDNVPLAMAASDVSGIGSDYNKGFFPDPTNRLAYDDSRAGGYQHTALFYNIVYSAFCAVPQIAVYTFDGSDTFNARTLENLAAYINADTSKRFVSYFRFDLYSGSNSNRVISEYYNESTFKTIAVPDILSDRPIPDSATVVKNAVSDSAATPPHNPPWIDNKIYSPFATALRRDYSQNYTENSNNQYSVGFSQQYTPTQLRNGYGAYNGGRVTGQFFRCNTNIQDFEDVKYQWEVVIYDMTDKVFLSAGYDITSLSHNIRFMTRLKILDKKDAATIGEANARAIKHEMAYIGFYFADSSALGQTGTLGSSGNGQGIYLPEIVNRTTTGRYFTGDEIKNVPYADADSVGGFPYDPGEVDGNEGDFSTQLQSGVLSAGTVYYALSDQELKDLLRFLNTTYNPDETTLAEDFKGANPFEYITSVKYYPFCLPYAVAQLINVGPIATGVSGYILPYTYGNSSYSFFDMGSFTFTPRYNNFLDYSGTQINLFLPWCGTKQLDPAMWIASPGEQPITLKIKYSFDYVTGAVTAFLLWNNGQQEFVIDTADGQVGIDIPMSALATGSYQQQIAQAQIAYKQAATSTTVAWLGLVGSMIGTAVAAASGVGAPAAVAGVVGIASSAGQLIKNTYQEESVTYTLDHTSPNVGSVSAASPFNAAIFDQRPRILISRPQLQQLPTNWAESYGKSIGYACSIPTKLNNATIRGLTIVQAPRLQGIKKVIGSQTFTPTREELDLIRQAMAEGIIL